MRMSGLANDFQKGKNINFESNDPASRQKYHLKKELVGGFGPPELPNAPNMKSKASK